MGHFAWLGRYLCFMQRVILNVNTAADAKLLVRLAKSLSFVSSATIEKAEPETDRPLTAEDWVRPGRPATDEELKQLVEEMENDTGEFTLDEVVNDLLGIIREEEEKASVR